MGSIKYVIGIHSNAIPSGGLMSSHAWITLTTLPQPQPLNGKKMSVSYGLWPDSHPKTTDNGPETDVRVGLEAASGLYNRYFELSAIKYAKFIQLVATTAHWRMTNNCSSWASDMIYNLFKIDIDADEFLGLETPRELSDSIRILEMKQKTSIASPKKTGAF